MECLSRQTPVHRIDVRAQGANGPAEGSTRKHLAHRVPVHRGQALIEHLVCRVDAAGDSMKAALV